MLGDPLDDAASARRPAARSCACAQPPCRKSDVVAPRRRWSAASGSQRSLERFRLGQRVGDGAPRPRRRRHLGQGQERGQADLRVGVAQARRCRAIAATRLRRCAAGPATALRRTPADGCFSAAAAAASTSRSLPSERPSPCSVHRAWIAPAFRPIASTRRVVDQLQQRRHHVGLAALDQQPLGVQPPEHVVVLQRGDELLRRRVLRATSCRPPACASFATRR